MSRKNMFLGAKPSTFQNANRLRRQMTPSEEILWTHLRNKKLGGYKIRKQHPISNFILDFYCHAAKLAIEIDGLIHEDPSQKTYDDERTKILGSNGIMVLRFRNDEVKESIDDVKNKILECIILRVAK